MSVVNVAILTLKDKNLPELELVSVHILSYTHSISVTENTNQLILRTEIIAVYLIPN